MAYNVTSVSRLGWDMTAARAQNIAAIVFGALLLAIGLWCMFVSDHLFPPFRAMTCNRYHGAISLGIAFIAVPAIITNAAAPYNLFYGAAFSTLCIMYFLPETQAILISSLNANWPTTFLHLGAGVLEISSYYGLKGRDPDSTRTEVAGTRTARRQTACAIGLSILFLVTGAWGALNRAPWVFMDVNLMFATMTFVIGITGVIATRKGQARGYNFVAGASLFFFCVLGFTQTFEAGSVAFMGLNWSGMVFWTILGGSAVAFSFYVDDADR